MLKKLLAVTTLFLTTTLISTAINAEDAAPTAPAAAPTTTTSTSDTSTSDDAKEMSKDKWLGAMTPLLPELICKGFMQDSSLKQRFDELKMTQEQCMSLIPDIASKCKAEIVDKIPATLNSESAGVWGKKLGECIGRDFAMKYLVPKS